MEPRPQSKKIDWANIIQTDDLETYLDKLPPTEAGIAFHSYLEEQVEVPGVEWEGELFEDGDLVGRYDCYDTVQGAVYEFKTNTPRGMSQAPHHEDIEQIEKYLDQLDERIGFLVYFDRANYEFEDYAVLH